VPCLFGPVVPQQHEIADSEPVGFALSPRGQSTGKIDSSDVSKRGKCEGKSSAAMNSREGRA
jgi:hypothetical protein